MEWGHRQLIRTVGIVFALPFAYFMARGKINKHLMKRLLLCNIRCIWFSWLVDG